MDGVGGQKDLPIWQVAFVAFLAVVIPGGMEVGGETSHTNVDANVVCKM